MKQPIPESAKAKQKKAIKAKWEKGYWVVPVNPDGEIRFHAKVNTKTGELKFYSKEP